MPELEKDSQALSSLSWKKMEIPPLCALYGAKQGGTPGNMQSSWGARGRTPWCCSALPPLTACCQGRVGAGSASAFEKMRGP